MVRCCKREHQLHETEEEDRISETDVMRAIKRNKFLIHSTSSLLLVVCENTYLNQK